MDWMYKEHAKDEKSSIDMNNQSGIGEIDGILDPGDDEKRSSRQAFLMHEEGDALEGNIEESSTVVSPATSDSDEFTTRVIKSKQPSDMEDVHESVDNSKENVPYKSDIIEETTSINCGVPSDDLGTMAEEVCKDASDKDKMIELLHKEVRENVQFCFS